MLIIIYWRHYLNIVTKFCGDLPYIIFFANFRNRTSRNFQRTAFPKRWRKPSVTT